MQAHTVESGVAKLKQFNQNAYVLYRKYLLWIYFGENGFSSNSLIFVSNLHVSLSWLTY